jgi:hypothetical protein
MSQDAGFHFLRFFDRAGEAFLRAGALGFLAGVGALDFFAGAGAGEIAAGEGSSGLEDSLNRNSS